MRGHFWGKKWKIPKLNIILFSIYLFTPLFACFWRFPGPWKEAFLPSDPLQGWMHWSFLQDRKSKVKTWLMFKKENTEMFWGWVCKAPNTSWHRCFQCRKLTFSSGYTATSFYRRIQCCQLWNPFPLEQWTTLDNITTVCLFSAAFTHSNVSLAFSYMHIMVLVRSKTSLTFTALMQPPARLKKLRNWEICAQQLDMMSLHTILLWKNNHTICQNNVDAILTSYIGMRVSAWLFLGSHLNFFYTNTF